MTVILCGLGGCLPPQIVDNQQISSGLDTTPEWIESRTGIRERRMVSDGLSMLDLAIKAGARALASADGRAVQAVVVATTSPERICPAVAPEVASALGLGDIAAYDITSACSGFVYGLATASGLIAAGIADSVLLIGAEPLPPSSTRKTAPPGRSSVTVPALWSCAVARRMRPVRLVGKMIAHQQKQLDAEALLAFRDRFALPLSDEDVHAARLFKPEADSPVMRYLHSRRQALHGYLPSRSSVAVPLETPAAGEFAGFASAGESKPMSTTLAFVRMLGTLLKAPVLGERIVPIVADEARTFGMANLFHKYGIYSPQGQLYTPEDKDSIVSYREARDGQILEEGITEAGAMSSWIAAGTAYSTHGMAMLPVYIFYSMFGFQRVADLIWAAADQRTRGFLIGATSGRTTLAGEGLQHQDGSSHVVAATVANCRAYDPAFAGELAVIVEHGLKCMLTAQEDVFYYLTVTNENYLLRSLPDGAEADVIKGMYLLDTLDAGSDAPLVRLLGSGAILNEVLAAANRLREQWGVTVQVWSVTSFSELERDARSAQHARLSGAQTTLGHVEQCLGGSAPVVAATDYVRAYAQLIAPYVSAPFKVLGTDGFGCSDTRRALRRYFEVDSQAICLTALQALVEQGRLGADTVAKARRVMDGTDKD